MSKGNDTRYQPGRQVGNHSLRAAVQKEVQRHLSTFGTVVGTMDDGGVTAKRPAPAGGRLPVPSGGAAGPGYSRPVFHGADADAIKLAQMQDNYDKAMVSLMVPPPDGARTTEGLVDTGSGRLSDGVERPVKAWVDESIKKKD